MPKRQLCKARAYHNECVSQLTCPLNTQSKLDGTVTCTLDSAEQSPRKPRSAYNPCPFSLTFPGPVQLTAPSQALGTDSRPYQRRASASDVLIIAVRGTPMMMFRSGPEFADLVSGECPQSQAQGVGDQFH